MSSIFLELIFNCAGHPREKKTLTNSLNFLDSSTDASDGCDHLQSMFLHDWKVRTNMSHKSKNSTFFTSGEYK